MAPSFVTNYGGKLERKHQTCCGSGCSEQRIKTHLTLSLSQSTVNTVNKKPVLVYGSELDAVAASCLLSLITVRNCRMKNNI